MSTHRRKSHRDRKIFESGYGAFPGGDPRKFYPDDDAQTDETREAYRLACEAWNKGETKYVPGVHRWMTSDEAKAALGIESTGPVHVAFAGFGLGSYSFREPMVSRKHRHGRGWRERAAYRARVAAIIDGVRNRFRAAKGG